jgi:phosphoribosylaminoimidazolecarboxamide formyltransferase / IMP cyclohydrolase
MKVRRALLSVSDKSGLVDFARELAAHGVALLSSGGTFKALSDAGIAVQSVESYTGSPEVMDGRVKTLHPRIHGGLLARAGLDDADLAKLGAEPIDLVVVNLYPFERVLASANASFEQLIENIDIGGPSMLRSAAKNHARVAVLCDSADYAPVLQELRENGFSLSDATRRRLALKTFAHTAAYDAAIANWLARVEAPAAFPSSLFLTLEQVHGLRYGENPHQAGTFYRERGAPAGSLARAESLGSGAKELSFNNLVDVDAALEAVRDFGEPAVVIVKHASPCGVAIAESPAEAYYAAREADAKSAFGGIVAFNRPVDEASATLLMETFIECIVAPSYAPAALELLRRKAALRVLATGQWLPAHYSALQYKRIGGGFVAQERDATALGEVRGGKVVTDRKPTESELSALQFAWSACKHVRSNAIVLAAPYGSGPSCYATVGIGGGQTARVTSVEIACRQAAERARGSVLASDAFFPFPDGVEAAARAGVTAIAQPGGSKADPAVIEAANRAQLAMVFTGTRHFRH